jgi:RNA polymerase sigma-70 factor (ECF subfamily)
MTIEAPHDRELLTRFLRGEEEALGVLASRYEPGLLGLARGLLFGRGDLAADAVQDTWLRVIRSARTYSGEASVKTWLYRILINRCHDLRGQAASAARATAQFGETRTGVGAPAVRPAERDPALQRAVDGLPEDRRTIILLCYHRGLTHELAAGVLGIPIGTLKSRLNAALKELRSVLVTRDAHEPQRA